MTEGIKSSLLRGLAKLLKIVWIVLKSLGKAMTLDFYGNLRKYWGKIFGKPKQSSEDKPPLLP